MTSGLSTPHIYPEYCHDLSPSIKKWCPLQIIDVHRLDDRGMYSNGRRLYHYGNHPIKWVRLTGLVVAVDEFYGRKVLTLDDSSGSCIECTSPAPSTTSEQAPTHLAISTGAKVHKNVESQLPNAGPSVSNPIIPWRLVDVGVVVKIKGAITIFRGQKQVEIIKVDILRSTDQEVRCWNESLQFRKEVLEIPWVVSQEQEKCCRRAMRGKPQEREKSKKTAEGRSKKKPKASGEDAGSEAVKRCKSVVNTRSEEEKEALRKRRKEKEKRERQQNKAIHRRLMEGEGPDLSEKLGYPVAIVSKTKAQER